MGRIALVGTVGVIVAGASVLAYANQPQARPLDPVGWVLLLAGVVALGWVRERPAVVLVVTALAATLYFALGYAYSVWPAMPLIAMYTSITQGRRDWGWAGAAFLVAVPAAGVALEPDGDNIVALVIWTLVVFTVAQLGEASRARRAYTAEVERRAAEAERTREEEARRRAQEERLRIARELHDVTSHTVSLIALQAAVAAEAVERAGGPEEARAALQVIRTASREALGEMKSILAVLRSGDAAPDRVPDDRPGRPGERDGPGPGGPRRDGRPPGDRGPGGHAAGNREPRGNHEPRGNREHRAAADRRPLPGIDRLRDLIAGAGVDVEFRTLGEERTLPPAVGLTVYRVIQEALTNTMRHAHATRAWVTLRFEPDGVGVRVADDGRGAPEDGQRPGGGSGGLGLLGMRERVAAMNGRLTVGNRPGGGFQVEAWLPVETA